MVYGLHIYIVLNSGVDIFSEADTQILLSMKHRGERIWLQTYLEQEKHVLRQMQGNLQAAETMIG